MNAPRETVKRAKQLRATISLPEVLLWRELRRENMGLRFRRQHPVGPYILDFYCAEAKLAVEVDGASHHVGARPAKDIARDRWLAEDGIRTLRLPARYVLKHMQEALESIVRAAHLSPQSASPTAPP